MSKTVEYRVRPVTRFVVTRFVSETNDNGACGCGSEERGEFSNEKTAYDVAYALCKVDHDALGYAPDDSRIKYPEPVIVKQIAPGPIGSGGLSAA